MSARPMRTAEFLMDDGWLSQMLQRPVHATHLRPKPGLSTVAAVIAGDRPTRSTDGCGHAIGWVQVCEAEHLDKVANAVRRAGERGCDVQVRRCTGTASGLWLATGAVGTDPRLARGFDDAAGAAGAAGAAAADLSSRALRYNPMRRVLLRTPDGQRVIRISAARSPGSARLLRRLATSGVPVVQPLPKADGVPATARVRVFPWLPGGDLLQVASGRPELLREAAAAAGAALAGIHRHPAPPGADPGNARIQLAERTRELRGVEDALHWWSPTLAGRAGALRRRIVALLGGAEAEGCRAGGEPSAGLVHGDFSPDQAVLTDSGEVAVIDFDRAGTGPFGLDLGSWVAVAALATPSSGSAADLAALPLVTAMIDGYRGADGPAATELSSVMPFAARSLLLRAAEPLREARPAWRSEVAGRLEQVERVLA